MDPKTNDAELSSCPEGPTGRNETDLQIIIDHPATQYEPLSEMAIMVDGDGNIIYLNRAAHNLLASSGEDVQGSVFSSYIKFKEVEKDSIGGTDPLETALRKMTHVKLERRAISCKDRELVIDGGITPLKAFNGNAIGALIILRDAGNLFKSPEKILKLCRTVEQSSAMIVITDTRGFIEYVNSNFTKVTGFKPEETIGKKPNILKSGKHNKEFYKDLWNTISQGKSWKGRITNQKKDGTLFDEDAHLFPVTDSTGKITNYCKTAYDATEQVLLESQLRQAQKMEAVGRLAGGIAHDFNNLLTGIQGYVELSRSLLFPNDPIYEYLNEIGTAANKASELVHQILAFSRKQMVSPRIINVNEIVSDMERIIRRVIGEYIEFSTILSPQVPSIRMDPGQLGQIIMNLSVNARDAMPQGGTVTIETGLEYLGDDFCKKFRFIIKGEYVMISVKDTGMGMDDETLSHIFEPFYTTKEKGKGTGLGLSTVYGIVKQANGYILVFSEPNLGTSFKLYFPPVHEQPVSVTKKPKFGDEMLEGTEKIFVVEDEVYIQKLLKKTLNKAGYTVWLASRGSEALNMFNNLDVNIDLLITDMVLPDIHGHELAGKLSKNAPGMKILFMSGYSEEEVAKDLTGLEKKGGFLSKPFKPIDLLKKIRTLLDK